ncbi:MAG: stage II sporulation protein P [Mycoplasmatota bacterium]|nr:stage II sporulation protein P [Mycoplasmatota bacterium]
MAHMKLKKVPKKKKFKYFILIILLYLTFSYTFYYSFKNNSHLANQEFINFLLNGGNISFQNEYKLPKLINKTINFFLKIDFKNPETIFNESILGYQDNEEDDTYSNLEKLKKISYYIEDPNKVDVKNPQVYIYNSHQLENYNNANLSVYGITPNVLMASYLLKEKLIDVGISTIVEDTNLTEFLELNNWSHANSYRASRIFMLDKKNTYSSLKYYIDIHRDSVSKNISTTKINNKLYARILFVVGKEHNNWEKNLEVVTEINKIAESSYPGLSRGIYKKEGPNVNGIYNQDISPNTILIELGGVDNTIDEVMCTINALTDILSTYINEKK